MKQSTKQQNTTTTTVKNPNWPEANQLTIYKCSWEVEPGTTRNKFSEWSERVLNPGSPDLKASTLTTGPHCLLELSSTFRNGCNGTFKHCSVPGGWEIRAQWGGAASQGMFFGIFVLNRVSNLSFFVLIRVSIYQLLS